LIEEPAAMSDFEVDYDKKTRSVEVSCGNVLEDIRKSGKDVLKLNPLQAYVEVPIDHDVSDVKGIIHQVERRAEAIAKEIVKEVNELVATLRKLQKEEEQGNKKAADQAEKLVKDGEKSVKKWADGFGAQIRKVVQEEVSEQVKGKLQLRSTSRTVFRGMELNEDAFEGGEGSEALSFVGDLAKTLTGAGKEAAKLTVQEKDLRRDLAMEIGRVKELIDKARGDKRDYDLREFAKANTKDVRSMESAVSKYMEFLTSFQDKLEEAKKTWQKLDNLIDKDEKLEKDKELNKHSDAYWDALTTVLANLAGKIEATKEAQRLFKDDYKDGSAWKNVIVRYEAQKGATKSGKAMQDSGAALEKLAKG
jgi:hypothetical protein